MKRVVERLRLALCVGAVCAVAVCARLLAAGPPEWTNVITAAEIRATVSFLASDSLQGRNTPSAGLETSADYIISEFRRFGLASPPGGSYAQTASFVRVTHRAGEAELSVGGAGESMRSVPPEHIRVRGFGAVRFSSEPVFKWDPRVKVGGDLKGKILMLRAPSSSSTVANLQLASPDAIVELVRKLPAEAGSELISEEQARSDGAPILYVPADDLQATFDRLPSGPTAARATLRVNAPTTEPAPVRNVIGCIEGSASRSRSECILISAHYDHLGVAGKGANSVFHGANDNASGVAAVLALAHALASRREQIKRTLVFLCFFGEEEGLLGSSWYVNHPVYPLARTVMEINFEQMGIPEPGEGLPPGSMGVTGFGFSNLPALLEPALADSGVHLRDRPHNDDFFARSDNYPFAQAGVPSHTFVAAFEYPDYHRVTDEWQHLDYENEARLVRALAAAIDGVANSSEEPHWNENGKTKAFASAWRGLHR